MNAGWTQLALARTRVATLLAGEHGPLAPHVERELRAIERHLQAALATQREDARR